MKQKVKLIKIGNSVGFTLPANIREAAGLKLGDAVMVDYNAFNTSVILKKKTTKKRQSEKTEKTANFLKIVDQFISEHEDVLKELSER